MLYLLGGAARAGKSAIARQFLAETGIPYFSLDFLMMGFANGLPEYGVDPEDDEWKIGELLWPVVKSMATALVEDEVDYLIEGAQLHPRHVWELVEQLKGHVRACFVGFAAVDTLGKLQQIRSFGGGSDDWLRHFGDQEVIKEIGRLKAFSEKLKSECTRHGLTYLEASTDLRQVVDAAVRCLKG